MTGADETIVPATAELVARYLGKTPPHSFRGWIAMKNGEPIGMAGVYDENGTPVAFSQFKPDARPRKRTMVKGARLVEQMLAGFKRPVLAVCSRDMETSPPLLAALGFQPTGVTCERGAILVRFAKGEA